jgi:hypothetical protein
MNLPLFYLNHDSIRKLADLARETYLAPHERLPGYTFATDEDTDAQAYFSIETLRVSGIEEECIVLSFRGTESAKDALIDISATRVPLNGKSYSFFESFLPNKNEVLVHWGFYHQYQSILPEIRNYLNEHSNIEHVVTCGHSLGGALATLAVVDLADRKCGSGRKYSCLTLGSPRVGNKAFADKFGRITNNRSLRIVNNDDPIPLLPSSLRFYHVTGAVELETDNSKFVRTYIPSSRQRWNRVGRVLWNTVRSTAICGEGSAMDHSSEEYCKEIREVLY